MSKEGSKILSLNDLYDKHHGKITDTWAFYIDALSKAMHSFRDKQVKILEIGVQNGGSLEIWGKYFSNAKKIIGVDIDAECGKLHFTDPRISIIVCDASSIEGKNKVLRESDTFDIIIDDGSHKSGEIVRAFGQYFPILNEGDIYIIEDLHCSYWADYGGGLFYKFSAIAFLKQIADIVNYEHWRTRHSRVSLIKKSLKSI